jgi:hypothetical protein
VIPGRCTLHAALWLAAALLSMPRLTAFAGHRAANAAATVLSGDSTLADWRGASSSERSRVAVELARERLKPDATKLEIATAAMEITGCLGTTANDLRFSGWKVAPTAATCLTAPEKPKD